MGGMFGSKPDTSAADEAREKAEKERDEVKKKNEARIRNLQNRSRGRSLLAFAGERGVADGLKTKLGE